MAAIEVYRGIWGSFVAAKLHFQCFGTKQYLLPLIFKLRPDSPYAIIPIN